MSQTPNNEFNELSELREFAELNDFAELNEFDESGVSRHDSRRVSRRGFLKGLGAAGVATAAVAATGALTSCRSKEGDEIFKGIRTIVDDAGRELEIPTASNINSVYFTSGLAQVFIITLAPDLMGATCSRYTDEDKQYLPEELEGLKYLGAVETGEMDVEAVMSQGIQIIFSISSIELTQANIDEAVDIQDKSGIPVVLIDGSFDKIGHAYEMLGDILGRQDRAELLSQYCQNAYDKVTAAVADVPENELVSFYYAEGPKGLQTEPKESQHAMSFEVANGYNVAQVEEFDATGMADVSLESVIAWNPQVIVTWDSDSRGGACDLIRASQEWSVIDAVKNNRVYPMPNIPIAWVDRPMACNRYLGIQWLANLFYPTRYNVDMVEVTQEFYELFYGKSITKEAVIAMLENSYQGEASTA